MVHSASVKFTIGICVTGSWSKGLPLSSCPVGLLCVCFSLGVRGR